MQFLFAFLVFALTFSTPAWADSLESEEAPVNIDNFQCLWFGNEDDKAHFEELRLAAEYREKRFDLRAVGGIKAVAILLRRIDRPAVDAHDLLHVGAIAQAGKLMAAADGGDPAEAEGAGDAFLKWVDKAYAETPLACPEKAPAKYRPTVEQLKQLADCGESCPDATAEDVILLLNEARNNPAAMVAVLEDRGNWTVLDTGGKLQEAVKLLIDRTLDIEVAKMRAIKDSGMKSPETLQASLEIFVHVSDLAEEAGTDHRLDQVSEVISVITDMLNP